MSKLEAIEAEIRSLPRKEAEELQDWLSEYLEDRAELNPEFVESIERGKADLKPGEKTPKNRRRMTREEVIEAIERSTLRFTGSWDDLRRETRE